MRAQARLALGVMNRLIGLEQHMLHDTRRRDVERAFHQCHGGRVILDRDGEDGALHD